MKKYLKMAGIGLCSLFLVTACGSEEKKEVKNEEKKEITMSIWEGTGEEYLMEVNSIAEAYSKVAPNVVIKVEKIPGTEYDTAMKIRNTAKKLPDIFAIRNKNTYTYKDAVLDLSDLEAAKINTFAEAYKVEGKVLGLPMYGFNEFVYYRKSLFKELGLEVPTTWGEFTHVLKTIKENSEYIPLAIGAKDLWTTYPYGQFIPYLEKGGDDILNKMGDMKTPFDKGTPVYNAYKKVEELAKLKVAGPDPLGYGWSQETNLFLSKKAVMMAAGQWYYKSYMKEAEEGDKDDVGMFLMPVRDSKDEKFRYFVTGEVFLAIPKTSENSKEAKEFLNWFFKSEYYEKYINFIQVLPAVDTVKLNDNPFDKVLKSVDNKVPVFQVPGYANYTKIKNAVRYEANQLSQDLLSGVQLDELMNEWNQKWSKAASNVSGE